MSLMQKIRHKSYFVKLVLIIASVIFMGIRYANAQVAHYSFDTCDGTDESLVQTDADLQGGINCDCGLVGQSAVLDGANDRIVFPSNLKDLFEDDFSLEFYFQIEPEEGTTDILSFSTTCALDSSFTIRYLSNTNDILVNLTESINARIDTRATLNNDNCWHHILWVKSGLEYSFYSVSWSPTLGLSVTDEYSTIATPEQSTTYTLNTVTSGGCTQIDTVRVNVISNEDVSCENLLLPAAFTPNGDGLNDLYRISNTFIIESLESLEILDRWGTRVFMTNNVNEGWDGTFNGDLVNPGHYIYKISYTCQAGEFNKLGGFTVLR